MSLEKGMEFKRANTYEAVFFFLFFRKRYISLAINHGMAINLENQVIHKMYKEGKFPPEGWEVDAENLAREGAKEISQGLMGSFSLILVIAIISLSVAYKIGAVHLSYFVNYNLLASFLGTFLASWATLMELGGGFATYRGKALHELIHPAIFRLLFVPGVCLLLLSIVV